MLTFIHLLVTACLPFGDGPIVCSEFIGAHWNLLKIATCCLVLYGL